MSFWDQVRRLFGGGGTAQQNAVRDAMLTRVGRRETFTALDIANDVTANDPHRSADDLRNASDAVHALFRDGLLTPLGYGLDASGSFAPQNSPPIQQAPVNVVSSVGAGSTLTVEQRLRWLEEMREFSWEMATPETRTRWRRARAAGRWDGSP